MRTLLKTLFGLIATLLTIILITLLTFSWWFDPNDYKQDLISLVKQHTGRDLVIEQPIEFTLYPWLGAHIGGVKLSNAPGFTNEPFAEIRQLGIQLKLLPLLSRQIEVDTLQLHGLQLHLTRNAQGNTNWEDLTQNMAAEPDTTPADPTQPPSRLNLSVQRIDIQEASIDWKDQMQGQTFQLNPFNLNIADFSLDSPTPVQMNLQLRGTQPDITLQLELDTQLTLSNTLQHITLSDLLAKVTAQGAALPTDGISLTLNSSLALDLPQQHLGLTDLTLSGPQLNGHGNLTLQHWTAHPQLQAKLSLEQLNLDDYLPPATTEAESEPVAAEPGNPLQILNNIDLQAELQIGQFQASQIKLSDIRLTLHNQQGQLTLQPLQASLYQGKLTGSVQVDARRHPASIQVQNTLRDIQIGPLLRDLTTQDRILGQGDLTLDLNFTGLSANSIRRSLSGQADFQLTDGAYQGINLTDILRQASEVFSLNTGDTTSSSSNARTDFAMLKGSVTIQQGQVRNDDLQVQSPLLRINGRGNIDLVQDQVDYIVTTKLVGSLTGQGGKTASQLRGIPIPVRITGPLNDLSYRPDFSDVLKPKIQEQKQKILQRVEDKVKQKATELLGNPEDIGNALKGLLGR
jgi:AsmA protein